MSLQITFQKHKNKPNTLSCTRQDGSFTWSKIHPGLAIHDLIHYAVETTLGFQKAFFGLLVQGYNIEDFALPRTERPIELLPKNLPFEALYTEFLVGLFQMETLSGEPYPDFNQVLKEVYEEKKLEGFRPLSAEDIISIRQNIKTLDQLWKAIPDGESLILEF